ncbi:hypothetical protein LZ906_017565 (plasmid) [Paraclostridium ghonii]|uniref:hypothetical protein n=1 Tax=Paraclostridium ghonii TaxID=29358 RepID=UPI00202CE8BC|nr:hypothetical protein [Paeniclostridium ghonii]MCM0166533.1 hypothetical protein [Paeniclostridium ghonii]
MKNLVIPSKLTQGASKEQLLIEQEMNELIIQSNRLKFLIVLLLFTIIGIPLMLYFVPKAVKCGNRLRQLQGELNDLMISEAPNKK